MNWLKRTAIFSLVAFVLSLILGCGVKGDPLPPEKPPTLGRGRPTYHRATEEISIDKSQRRIGTPTKRTDEDGDEDKE